MEQNQPQNEELHRFRDETGGLLNISNTTNEPASALRLDNAQ